MIPELLLLVAVSMVAYTYVGYPLLLAAMVLIRRRGGPPGDQDLPFLSVLAVAFNEEGNIAGKIANVLAGEYPPDRIEVIVCSDGSTDRTNEIVERYGDQRVRLVASPTNVGVNEAFALGAGVARGDVMLLTDANAMFRPDAIVLAARHLADPRVGLVSGRIIFEDPGGTTIGAGYRAYWGIETLVRGLESRLGVATVIVGAFEMIRKSAYLSVPSRHNNDVIAPIYAISRGFLCRYEPRAVTVTVQKKTPSQDFHRRTRMAVRVFGSLGYLRQYVPILRNLGIWAMFLSHKLLRYFTWVFMLLALAANLLLLDRRWGQAMLAAQAGFYLLAALGWVVARTGRSIKALSMPFYFCLLQAAGATAFVMALRGKRMARWQPTD